MEDAKQKPTNKPKSVYKDAASCYCKDIANLNPLPKEEEVRLSNDIKKGGKKKIAAMHKLVQHNLKLVVKIASGYTGMGLELEDLISEGNIGAWEAAKRYDHEKGAKFSSYSSWWIKQKMRKALSNQSRNIRVPDSAIDRFNQIVKFSKEFEEKNRREPSRDEISEKFNMTKARVEAVFEAVLGTISLDAEIKDSEKKKIHELVEDRAVTTPAFNADENERGRVLRAALERGNLTDREKFIIHQRFGFVDERETLEAVGVKLKITRERVRQIEEVALWKIKNFLQKIDYK